MKTPICDFVRDYVAGQPLRCHMPGHKGSGPLGIESLDLTEIPGADSLYEAHGIIRESEDNAADLFGARHTVYSCEGSSLGIRSMVALIRQYAARSGRPVSIWAGRNAHKTFLTGCALLDVEVKWLRCGTFLSGMIDPAALDAQLCSAATPPAAVWVTSPDYLGGMADIQALAQMCHQHGVLLVADNAHGAYLRFLPESLHPLDLGADLCCDSAHKTLPVLTGGAYVHVSRQAPAELENGLEEALALFGSTSPSYLILQSLDAFNEKCQPSWQEALRAFLPAADRLKEKLRADGWTLHGREPLKLTLAPKGRGYTGTALQDRLMRQGIYPEFADPDWLVLMLSPDSDLSRLAAVLDAVPPGEPLCSPSPALPEAEQVMSPRQALLAPQESLPVADSLGRILGAPTVSCPPAVPILCCGERIDPQALRCFAYYGVKDVSVVARLS